MASCIINGEQRDLSWKVWNESNPDNQIVSGDGNVVHHWNEIHEDNRLENLQKMTRGEHGILHFKGKKREPFSDEWKKNISINHANMSGKNNPMHGRKQSDETKEKMSKKAIGRKSSEETKEKISTALKGKNHPNYGISMTEEQKRKISEAHKGMKQSEETKEKISTAHKGSKNPKAKVVIAEYKYFGTLKEAGEFLNVSVCVVSGRIKRKVLGYCYTSDIITTFINILNSNSKNRKN